jgi:NiFe hydrogenase
MKNQSLYPPFKIFSIHFIKVFVSNKKIEIFLDDNGNVRNAYLQVPELKGFEQFYIGRPVEELPRIVPRICGVCPTTHHLAAPKAVDALKVARAAGEDIPKEYIIYGIEAKETQIFSEKCTPQVEAAIPRIVKVLLKNKI